MEVKKIAVLVEAINSHSGSRAPIEIAKSLKEVGLDITIIGFRQNSDTQLKKTIVKSGIRLKTVLKPNSFLRARILPNLQIKKLLKKDRFDIAILAAFLPSALATKLAGIPIVKIYMGTQFNAYLEKFAPNKNISFVDRFFNLFANLTIYTLELVSLLLANYTVSISHYCSKELRKMYFKKSDAVIYLGGNHLPSPALLKKDHLNTRTVNLLSVSRITPYKNFHLLIETVKKINSNEVFLNIVGTDRKPRYLAYLKKIITTNTRLIINPSDSELARLYASCDVYITADRYLFFGFPIVEAAFFGKPAVALNFSAAKEVIKSGQTGYVTNNFKEFLQALERFLKNASLRKKMGISAKKYAQAKFDWKTNSNKYLKLFEKISQ